MKTRKLSLIFTLAATTLLASCGGGKSGGGSGGSGGGGQTETSLIKSIDVKNPNVQIKLGETVQLPDLYTVVPNGNTKLTSSQALCTYVSSNPAAVKVISRLIKAIGLGDSDITITSVKDPTKTNTLHVTVLDVYFDREYSKVFVEDNFEHELVDEGHYVESTGGASADYYIKDVFATKFMTTVTCQMNGVTDGEDFPKMGIQTNTMESTAIPNNAMYFFFNPEQISTHTSWTAFGMCEVQNGSNWAWNPGVTHATARHIDHLYESPTPITYGTQFSLTMVRNDFDFHFWVNDIYVGSVTTLEDLFGKDDGSGNIVPAESRVGYFQFNSKIKFSNYSYSLDETEIAAKIGSVTLDYKTEFDPVR